MKIMLNSTTFIVNHSQQFGEYSSRHLFSSHVCVKDMFMSQLGSNSCFTSQALTEHQAWVWGYWWRWVIWKMLGVKRLHDGLDMEDEKNRGQRYFVNFACKTELAVVHLFRMEHSHSKWYFYALICYYTCLHQSIFVYITTFNIT